MFERLINLFFTKKRVFVFEFLIGYILIWSWEICGLILFINWIICIGFHLIFVGFCWNLIIAWNFFDSIFFSWKGEKREGKINWKIRFLLFLNFWVQDNSVSSVEEWRNEETLILSTCKLIEYIWFLCAFWIAGDGIQIGMFFNSSYRYIYSVMLLLVLFHHLICSKKLVYISEFDMNLFDWIGI